MCLTRWGKTFAQLNDDQREALPTALAVEQLRREDLIDLVEKAGPMAPVVALGLFTLSS